MKVIKAVPYRTVDDLDKEIQFYTHSMHYEIVESRNDDDGIFWAELKNGGSHIMLSNRKMHDRRSLTWFYVEDVDKAYDLVLQTGGNPHGIPRDYGHGTVEFLMEDESGNTLVIAQLYR